MSFERDKLHIFTLREFAENPTLMSDEPFVPLEEVDALLEELARVQCELELSQYSEKAALKVACDNAMELKALKLKYQGGIYGEETGQARGP